MSKNHAFVSYNAKDWEETLAVCDALKCCQPALRLWLDKKDLRYGSRLITSIAQAVGDSSSMLVVIGRHGIGKYQLEEINIGHQLYGDTNGVFRLIPVFLPKHKADPLLRSFTGLTWHGAADGEVIRLASQLSSPTKGKWFGEELGTQFVNLEVFRPELTSASFVAFVRNLSERFPSSKDIHVHVVLLPTCKGADCIIRCNIAEFELRFNEVIMGNPDIKISSIHLWDDIRRIQLQIAGDGVASKIEGRTKSFSKVMQESILLDVLAKLCDSSWFSSSMIRWNNLLLRLFLVVGVFLMAMGGAILLVPMVTRRPMELGGIWVLGLGVLIVGLQAKLRAVLETWWKDPSGIRIRD